MHSIPTATQRCVLSVPNHGVGEIPIPHERTLTGQRTGSISGSHANSTRPRASL